MSEARGLRATRELDEMMVATRESTTPTRDA
jgi:hypothetical protein